MLLVGAIWLTFILSQRAFMYVCLRKVQMFINIIFTEFQNSQVMFILKIQIDAFTDTWTDLDLLHCFW